MSQKQSERKIFVIVLSFFFCFEVPIDGNPNLKPLTQKLLFGEANPKIASVQALSGTGSLRVFAEFANTRLVGRLRDPDEFQVMWVIFLGSTKIEKNLKLLKIFQKIYFLTTKQVPQPTWGNHNAIFKNAGFNVKPYTYWDSEGKNLNFDQMCKDILENAKKGDCILLHAVAHNPTGVDPKEEQWKRIAEICIFF